MNDSVVPPMFFNSTHCPVAVPSEKTSLITTDSVPTAVGENAGGHVHCVQGVFVAVIVGTGEAVNVAVPVTVGVPLAVDVPETVGDEETVQVDVWVWLKVRVDVSDGGTGVEDSVAVPDGGTAVAVFVGGAGVEVSVGGAGVSVGDAVPVAVAEAGVSVAVGGAGDSVSVGDAEVPVAVNVDDRLAVALGVIEGGAVAVDEGTTGVFERVKVAGGTGVAVGIGMAVEEAVRGRVGVGTGEVEEHPASCSAAADTNAASAAHRVRFIVSRSPLRE